MGGLLKKGENRKTRGLCFALRFTASGHEVDIEIATPFRVAGSKHLLQTVTEDLIYLK